MAAWLADQGFPTMGVDIAPSAIARAARSFGQVPGRLEFMARDICLEAPPDRRYRVLVDCGCLHQIPAADAPRYLATITSVATPDARMLLFVKAFRGGVSVGDAAEWRRVSEEVEGVMFGTFDIVRRAATFLDAFGGRDPARALPGIAFWLVRRGADPATDHSQ